MRVVMERTFAGRTFDVWFLRDDFAGARQVLELPPPGDALSVRRWVEFAEGAKPAPTLTLEYDMLEALLEEAEKVIPASHATERHLADAIATRDRLLTIVEAIAE